MVRRFALSLLLPALLIWSQAAEANLLVNGGFESLDRGWTITGGASFSRGSNTPDGGYALYGGSDSVVTQEVGVPSRWYSVDMLADWQALYPYSYKSLVNWDPGRVTMALLVDGVEVSNWSWTATDPRPAGWPPSWSAKTLTWSGVVSSKVGVRFTLHNGVYSMLDPGPQVDTVVYPVGLDRVSLNATPEPSSLVGLIAGIAGIFFGCRFRGKQSL